MWKRLLNKYTIRNGVNILQRFVIGSSFLIKSGTVAFYNDGQSEQLVSSVSKEIEEPQLDVVQNACKKSDDALKELLNTLTVCILELSKEYQTCLMRQIEITYNCSQIGPLGEHWDNLTEYRVRAKDFKDELMKYEALVGNIGQMVYNQALNSLYSGNPQAMELFSIEYERLEKLIIDEKKEILYWEQKLLSVNCDSIMAAVK